MTTSGGAVTSVNVSAPLLEASIGTLFKVSTVGASADSGSFAVVEVATLTPEQHNRHRECGQRRQRLHQRPGGGHCESWTPSTANAEGSPALSSGAITVMSISESGFGYPVGTVLDMVQSGSGNNAKVTVGHGGLLQRDTHRRDGRCSAAPATRTERRRPSPAPPRWPPRPARCRPRRRHHRLHDRHERLWLHPRRNADDHAFRRRFRCDGGHGWCG